MFSPINLAFFLFIHRPESYRLCLYQPTMVQTWRTFLLHLGLLAIGCGLLIHNQPLAAATYSYDDLPAAPILLDEDVTVLCNAPLIRSFAVADSFLVNDIDIGLTVEHSYRSDIRLVLESPKGTRQEVLVEFDTDPEDENENYDILFDDDVVAPLDDGDGDDITAPHFERAATPTNPLTIFNGERAQGTWLLEICDAGVLDGGLYLRSRLNFDGTPVDPGPLADTISGLIFRDYNADGRWKPRAEGGVAGITVNAYGNEGGLIATTITDSRGEYSLTVPNGTMVRVEVTDLPAYLQPGPVGADSATTVFFVTSPALEQNVGLANPGQHAQNSNAMQIALPRYAYGAHDGNNANLATLLAYQEDDGSYALLHNAADSSLYDADSTVLAQQTQTGAIWGMAYDRLHDQLLGAALLKRHTGLGTTGNPTAIYRFEPSTQSVSEWLTLDPNRPSHRSVPTLWEEDFAVYDWVGKEGWGDIDMSDDLRTLYGIDLGTRTLVQLPILADGAPGTPVSIDLMSSLAAKLVGTGEGLCPVATDLRPFGLGINDGQIYIGVVCTAESTVAADAFPIQAPTKNENLGAVPGDFSKIWAYVVVWNGDVTTPDVEPVIDFPLRYPRGCASYNQQANCSQKYPGEWRPWANQFPYSSDGSANPPGTTAFEAFYPQALLSNIEFYNGNMVLFLMDRFGNQAGAFTQSPYGEMLNHVAAHSDILFACAHGDGWVMEKTFSGDEGCSTGIRAYIRGEERANEYFGEDTYRARFALHGDVGFGAGLVIPGRESVIHTVFDPVYATDVQGDTLFDGGLHWYTLADGHWRKSIRVYNNQTGVITQEGTFSKAVGLGDVVALTEIPPIEIGNRVWLDSNRDGLQSPGETGIADVMVELFCPTVGPDGIAGNGDDAIAVATAQTDADGHYYFSSANRAGSTSAIYNLNLVSTELCQVRIPDATGYSQQAPLAGYLLTEANDQTPSPNGSDLNDADGQPDGNAAEITFVIGAPGANNHTYDFGFVAFVPTHSLGNQVWFDSNDNAMVDAGEPGLNGIALTLYAGNDSIISTTVTGDNGLYLFTDLPAGDYRVGVDESNFASGGPLAQCRSSSEALDEDAPNADSDNNDNGLLDAGSVRSGLITLGDGEPMGETPDNDPATPDNRENLTLDFGFFCGHSIGNQVWFDVNNNTMIDNDENGIPNVALTLYDANGTPADMTDDLPVAQTTTDDNGLYLFDWLPAGEYYVAVVQPNFEPTGLLQGCISSNELIDEDDPNLDQDNNDNGQLIETATGSYFRSGLIRLGSDEPLGESPDNDPVTVDRRENLTIDFGCFMTLSLGNRVWIDDGAGDGVADNGTLDGAEIGVAGVVLMLLNGNKTPVLGPDNRPLTTTTDIAGYYLFTDLLPGDYVVQVLPGNFATGGALAGYRSSATTEEDPNQDGDTNDNGIDDSTPLLAGVCSNVVTLAHTSEPGQESDPGQLPDRALDTNSNLTVDFGFYAQSPTAIAEEAEPTLRKQLFLPFITQHE